MTCELADMRRLKFPSYISNNRKSAQYCLYNSPVNLAVAGEFFIITVAVNSTAARSSAKIEKNSGDSHVPAA